MPRRTFPDGTIFAEDSQELITPDSSWADGYESGAGAQPPEAGVHNYEFKRLDEMCQHIEQHGVPEWSASTLYALRGWCLGSDGMLYRARLIHSGQNPVGDDGTYWRSIASITAEKMHPVGSAVMRPTNPGLPEADGGLGFGTWADMEGRSPMGSGTYQDGDGNIRVINSGNSYGYYRHTLTESEMPSHSHDVKEGRSSPGGTGLTSGDDYTSAAAYIQKSGESGNNQSHNNLHPVFGVKIWYRTS